MSFDINQQMQANLAEFYLNLKQGHTVVFQDLHGVQFEGKVHLVQPSEYNLLFLNVRNLKNNELIKFKLMPMKEISFLKISSRKPEVQESGQKSKKQKTFVRWDEQVQDAGLEDKPQAGFDQFEAMKQFGLEVTFDENSYTTQVREVNAEWRRFAEQHFQELKLEQSDNRHVMEERNLIELNDDDEEALYSSVVRQPQQQSQQSGVQLQRSNISTQQPIQPQPIQPVQQIQPQQPKIKQKVELIPDEDQDTNPIIKPNSAISRFKVQQAVVYDIPKQMLMNFMAAVEGYKWQNMVPDSTKNKKEKLQRK